MDGDTCDQFVWSGSDIENIYPTVAMNGLTANSHYDRGRIYDAYGWWPFTLWSDNNGKWYSYMHTEDAVQVTTGQTGHGSDLRTIALWTSTDNGANWTYEGVALSIDSDYAVPGNLQVSWPRNGGTGDHKLIASPDGQYLYILYTVFSYEDPATTNDYCHGNLAIARAELDEEGRPGPFYKYYNGQFSESGVGGHETWIMSKTEGPYYTDNSQRTVMWNTYLNRYGIAVNANEKIFFVLDSNGSSAYDSTYWDPQIEYSPLTRMLDSRNEYSSTSGEWGYLSESNGAYSAMEWNSAEKQWKVNGSYCSIGALHMHPDANLNAVRSWRCEEAGNIVISNEVKKLDITGGDGVRLKILKNGTQIWPESGWGMLDFDDAQGIKFSVATSVNTGDTICFVLNQNQSSSYDTTYWLSNIKIAS